MFGYDLSFIRVQQMAFSHTHACMHALLSIQLAMERTNSKETNKKRIQSTVYENDYNYLNYYIYDKF